MVNLAKFRILFSALDHIICFSFKTITTYKMFNLDYITVKNTNQS